MNLNQESTPMKMSLMPRPRADKFLFTQKKNHLEDGCHNRDTLNDLGGADVSPCTGIRS
jgi:hypothetical protein